MGSKKSTSNKLKTNEKTSSILVVFINSQNQKFANFKGKFIKAFPKVLKEEAHFITNKRLIDAYNNKKLIYIYNYDEAFDNIIKINENDNCKNFILYGTEDELNFLKTFTFSNNNVLFIKYEEEILIDYFRKEMDYDSIPDNFISEISILKKI